MKFLINNNCYFVNMSNITVSDALEGLKISNDVMKVITSQRDIWMTFGKKNSHLLRAQLFKMFEDAKLTAEGRFMIFYFFAMIKNKNRVLDAMDNLTQQIKSEKWFKEVQTFIKTKLVQYVSEEKNGKFAVVHLPTTMPGLDILSFALASDGSLKVVDEIIKRQCFAQLDLDDDLQAENKAGQIAFWDNIVRKSNNSNQSAFKQGFQEEFYNTSAGDKYCLLDQKLAEVTVPPGGYSKSDVEKWFEDLFSDREVAKNSSKK